MNFRDPSYLLTGTPRQAAAHRALIDSEVLKTLSEFDPVLAGTIPIGIDLPDSDLDILCCAQNLDSFKTQLTSCFSLLDGFTIRERIIRNERTIISNFHAHEFEFEIFAQQVPVERQYGYVHLLVEDRLLRLGGNDARNGIRRLKESGLKTEPAFARYFSIEGDPYEALYEMCALSEEELKARVVR